MSTISKKLSAGLVVLLLDGAALVSAGPPWLGADTMAAALAGMGALAIIMARLEQLQRLPTDPLIWFRAD